MSKFVQRIVEVKLDDGSRGDALTVYKSKKGRKKVSGWLKPMEKRDRRLMQATAAFSKELLARHDRSNRKRRNGWLRDAPLNMFRALRKGVDKLVKI